MKKLTLVLILFVTILLTSCGGNKKVTAVIDKPAEEISTALNLEAVKNGNSVNSAIDKTKDYADVKIANNASTTLFYDVIDLETHINNSFMGVNVNTLVFSSQVVNYVPTFLAELNNAEYGLTAEGIGKTFTVSESGEALFKGLVQQTTAKLPEGYDLEKQNVLVVVYLPVYCIYNAEGQDIIKSFMLVPVYYNYTYVNDGVVEDSNITDINKYVIALNDKGLLPSAE